MLQRLKKIFSRDYEPPNDSNPKSSSPQGKFDTKSSQTLAIPNTDTTLHIEVGTRKITDQEKHRRELGKLATQLKGKNWDQSIECLREARTLMPLPKESGFPVAEYLRLPLYLQQAGRMPEAEDEFRILLAAYGPGPERKIIEDKIRLARKREAKKNNH